MRLRIVYDEAGRIIAAADLDGEGLVVLPEPISSEQASIELEVPYEHRKGNLAEICQRLRVDRDRQQLVSLE
jgi:hypothetical protein